MLIVPEYFYKETIDYVVSTLPIEACGLLAGLDMEVSRVYSVRNILNSPLRYSMDPFGQLNAMLAIEKLGLELLAIFHSHPQGPDHPSQTDIREFLYPGVLSVIVFPDGESWNMRVFQINAESYEEVKWKLV